MNRIAPSELPGTPGYTIFLDTQVFDAASFNFASQPFVSLEEQVEVGRVRVLLTDITVREVEARIEKTVANQLAPLVKLIRDARVLRSSQIPGVTAALELDQSAIAVDLQRQFEAFLQRIRAEIVDTSQVPAGPVFEKYFAAMPPFGHADEKSEFPDAFVIDALASWADRKREQVYVVSGDGPVQEACKARERLAASPRLSTLLDGIVLQTAVASFVRHQTVAHIDEVRAEVKAQFQDHLYNVDDEWGDVEMDLNSLDLVGQPEIIEASDNAASLEVRFQGAFTAHLSYDDSSTGVYDSETKGMMFMDRVREDQEKEEEFLAEVRVRFAGLDEDSFEIERVNLVQPDESYTVSTSRWDGYPWK